MHSKLKWCVCLELCIFNLLSGTSPLYHTPTHISNNTHIYETQNPVTTTEDILIQHVKNSIAEAELKQSKLSKEILQMQGMSSDKVRHFLNKICALPHAKYLEIGVWKGSTFISALYENHETIDHAVSIDNWCGFSGPQQEFKNNCQHFLGKNEYAFYAEDCFKIDPTILTTEPINIYFYDGEHRFIDQEMAFEYYDSILDETFIAIVDDWNWEDVKKGTFKAFDVLSYDILYEASLPSRGNCDTQNWWNGFYVAVIRKHKLTP